MLEIHAYLLIGSGHETYLVAPLDPEPDSVQIWLSATPMEPEMTELGPKDKHELRTALALVRGGAGMLSDKNLDRQRWQEAADLVVEGLQRLASIDLDELEEWEMKSSAAPAD